MATALASFLGLMPNPSKITRITGVVLKGFPFSAGYLEPAERWRRLLLGERFVADLKLIDEFGNRLRQLCLRRLAPETIEIVKFA